MSDPTNAIPGSLPAPTPAEVAAATAREDPRAAARRAAELRLQRPPVDPPSTSSDAHGSAPFNPSAADKLPFHRLLDSEVLPKCSKPQAVKTLETLIAMTSNILQPPNPLQAAKYRQVRLANGAIKRNVIDVPGAYDFLIAAGFRQTNVNFEAFLTFSPSPSQALLHKLKCANFVLKEVVKRAMEAAEREKRFRESEVEAEKARVGKALLGFDEDRRLKRERDEREKIGREAKARLEAEAAATPPVLPATDAAMAEDDEDDDPPPSYGQLHGRVLGTGEAVAVPNLPSHVRQVHAQDEEFDDEEE
ncbi:hypothetical protein T439DRAFT_344558 [Meredithblackwellia eburnea MCA 4105]